MKVLINAYACSPYEGSEPGMGWNFVSNLAHIHELHVITECKYIHHFERYFKEHPEEKKFYHFYYVKRLRLDRLRKIWPPSYYWTYAAWQRKALKLAKELDKKENFDVIHQLNMVGYREPGYLWKMDKPLVWGPMGNFNITPWNMLPVMGLYGTCFYAVRNIMNWWQARYKTRVRRAAMKASAIICAMEDDRKAVKRFYGKDAIVIPEVGLTKVADIKHKLAERNEGEKLKVCWSGVHIPRKALPLLLEAVALTRNKENIELHILGKGPCTKKWKRLADDLSHPDAQNPKAAGPQIIWHGQTTRDEALKIMNECHVFTMTSLSEATSTVLLEALSLQIPVVALNHLGFAGVINDSCGIKIDLESPGQVTRDFAEALDRMYENEEWRRTLAEGALERAKEFSWDKKAKIIDCLYKQIIQRNNNF